MGKQERIPIDSDRLKRLRQDAGLSMAVLAERAGVDVATVFRSETRGTGSAETLDLIRQAINPEQPARLEWLKGDGKLIRIDSSGQVTVDRQGLTAEADRQAAVRAERFVAATTGASQILKSAGYHLQWVDPEKPGGPSLKLIRPDGKATMVYPAELVPAVVQRGLQAVDDLFPHH